MRSVVIGATEIVGSYIVDQLVRAGERPIALSRSERKSTDDVEWFEGDLERAGEAEASAVQNALLHGACGPACQTSVAIPFWRVNR